MAALIAMVGPGAQPADLLFDLAQRGEHDDRDVAGGALLGPDLGGYLVAVKLGQHDVEQDEVRHLGRPQAVPFRAVRGDDDVVTLLLERVLQEPLDVRVVIDYEDLGRHQASVWLAGPGASTGTGRSWDRSFGAPIICPAPGADAKARRKWSGTRRITAARTVWTTRTPRPRDRRGTRRRGGSRFPAHRRRPPPPPAGRTPRSTCPSRG